jgi:hypothetical protein
MPVTPAQLALGANYQIQAYAKNDPIDQFTQDRPFSQWLVENMEQVVYGNGIFNEKVRFTNNSNYQNFTGDGQVSYNRKDTVRLAAFYHYEAHDGFALNETELADNGITMTDDKTATPTDSEKIQLVNKLKEGYSTLKDGFQEQWDLEVHRDGTQSTLAVPGLDALISTTPTVGIIGGIDRSNAANAYWRNWVSGPITTGLAANVGNLLAKMEVEWRHCITFGKLGPPNKILCGDAFLDALAADIRAQAGTNFTVTQPAKGGFVLDGARSRVFFKGVEVEWDPTFNLLDAAGPPSVPWAKRCYFLNNRALKLKPNKGRWLINRKPPRMYDRYVYYFGLTADYGITVMKPNSCSVLYIN